MSAISILNHFQISHKIKRLAWQIYENNMENSEIWIAGIDERGQFLAQLICQELNTIGILSIQQFAIQLNRETYEPLFLSENNLDELANKTVILVDDVLNSGKTIMSCLLPLLEKNVAKIELAVLASRSHKKFPLKADYVGISMATTLQEHLLFDNGNINDLKMVLV